MMARVDGFDISLFQGGMDWAAIQAKQFMAIRVLDGLFDDPTFVENWRMAARLGVTYQCAYLLISDVDPNGQINRAINAINSTGVPWTKSMGLAWDVENTKAHPTASPETVAYVEQHLCNVYNRPYGLWYGHDYVPATTEQQGKPLWYPWPESNGPLEIAAPVSVLQWGTAGPGEQPGFPNSAVDVNQVNDSSALDRVCGYNTRPIVINPGGLTMADVDTLLARINTLSDDLGNALGAHTNDLAKTVNDRAVELSKQIAALADPAEPTVQAIAQAVAGRINQGPVDVTQLSYLIARTFGQALAQAVPPPPPPPPPPPV